MAPVLDWLVLTPFALLLGLGAAIIGIVQRAGRRTTRPDKISFYADSPTYLRVTISSYSISSLELGAIKNWLIDRSGIPVAEIEIGIGQRGESEVDERQRKIPPLRIKTNRFPS